MADLAGISYLRTLRLATPVIYGPDDQFEIGGSRVLRSSDSDGVAIVAAGITVHEALKAADTLAGDGISVRVIDAYSIKPIDTKTLLEAGERLVTVEDHWPEGGLGDAVLGALAEAGARPRVKKLAVSGMPRSGKPADLMKASGIDAEAIAAAVRELL
jgi:transketolase